MTEALMRLLLFALFVAAFLGPVGVFASLRLRRAEARGHGHLYVPHADPWLPFVLAAGGALALGLLSTLR
jgi:hypothetical protein